MLTLPKCDNTVKLVYKDHPSDLQNVVLMLRLSLYAGSILSNVESIPLGNVVFIISGAYIQVAFRAGLTL